MKKVELKELCIMNESQIADRDKIYLMLLQGFRCIFFTSDNNKLTGIVTQGDYNKSFDFGLSINEKYTYLFDSENCFEQAEKIFKDRPIIREIPVVDKNNGSLCYMMQRINNKIVDFLYNWETIDIRQSLECLNQFNKIYLCSSNDKIDGFMRYIYNYKEIVHIVSEEQLCHIGDYDLVITPYFLKEPINAEYTLMEIDELYLSLLGNYTVNKLSSNGIKYLFFQTPLGHKLRSENMIYYKGSIEAMRHDKKALDEIYNDDVMSKQYLISGEFNNVRLVKIGERYMLEDFSGEAYNVQNNLRYTQGNPGTFDRTIWMVGTCIVRGYGASDAKTIPSILQNLLKDNGIKNIRVINFGGGGGLNNFSDIRDFINILHTDINRNDIVVHIGYNVWDKSFSRVRFDYYYELS